MLWNNAPTFGDPAGLAQVVGLPPANNYEQALIKEQAHRQAEQARQQQEMEKAEREPSQINGWNRLAIGFRSQPGVYQSTKKPLS
jgi:hypothetical protein